MAGSFKGYKMPGQMTLFYDQDKIITEAERYILNQIKQLFDHDIMLADHPDRQPDITVWINRRYSLQLSELFTKLTLYM